MKPALTGREVDSFYHLSDVPMDHRCCRGTSCFAAKHLDGATWRKALEQSPPVYCLGKCYASPSTTETTGDPPVQFACSDPIVLAGVDAFDQQSLEGYCRHGGYSALEKARASAPEKTVAEVELSQLRGRGGAGFPAGRKWRSVFCESAVTKYVVANADEGDHGTYIDRFIMERVPHRLIEALALAGHAVGARKGYIYLRKEYPVAEAAVRKAMGEAESVLAGFEIELIIGQGSYVCGEETSLLNSIEHRRPEVRARPPYPTAHGLFNMPTLVNNVETLASIPWIVLHNGAAYAARGFSRSRGTKAVSLNSLFKRPGLYELEFGVPLRYILEELGGGLVSGDFKAAIVGGPLAGLIHPSEFDVPFGFEEMAAIGGAMGHGGIVAFDSNTRMLELLAHIFDFGAIESCGKCTPCRHGTRRAQQLFATAAYERHLSDEESRELRSILNALARTSLCGHGTGLAVFAESIFEKFAEEVAPCFS